MKIGRLEFKWEKKKTLKSLIPQYLKAVEVLTKRIERQATQINLAQQVGWDNAAKIEKIETTLKTITTVLDAITKRK